MLFPFQWVSALALAYQAGGGRRAGFGRGRLYRGRLVERRGRLYGGGMLDNGCRATPPLAGLTTGRVAAVARQAGRNYLDRMPYFAFMFQRSLLRP